MLSYYIGRGPPAGPPGREARGGPPQSGGEASSIMCMYHIYIYIYTHMYIHI